MSGDWKFLIFCSFYFICSLKADSPSLSAHLDEHWQNYKTHFNKTFNSRAAETNRRLAWEKNLELIKKHNEEHEKGLHTYQLKINHLADLSHRNYLKSIILPRIVHKPKHREITSVPHQNHTSHLPEELDWRKEGFITEPLNQEECGSCYAFAIASAIQGQYFMKRKKVVGFSVQQLIDCSIIKGNLGCSGGSLRNTLKYLQSVEGLMFEKDYPYMAKQSVCKFRKQQAAVKLQTWAILPPKDEQALKYFLTSIGPLAVSINSSPITFQLYSKGIYDDPICSSDEVNHAMLLVGYTPKAWILKNWWTDEWGEDGYMYLARGKNRCAIADYAAYATVEALSKNKKALL